MAVSDSGLNSKPTAFRRRLRDQPEPLLILLAFVFHFAWEMLQDPLYAGLSERPHGEVRSLCLMASLGDVVIAMIAFYAAALAAGSRFWFLNVKLAPFAAWISIGLLITVGLELIATRTTGRWNYSPLMPVIPLLRVGLAPLGQWLVIPTILVVLMNAHFRSERN